MANGDVPVTKIGETEHAFAIRDINPAAPMHVLVIPKQHYATVTALAEQAPMQVAELVELAANAAKSEANGDYRLIFNSGATAAQSVFHVHGHVIGGKDLEWNPA